MFHFPQYVCQCVQPKIWRLYGNCENILGYTQIKNITNVNCVGYAHNEVLCISFTEERVSEDSVNHSVKQKVYSPVYVIMVSNSQLNFFPVPRLSWHLANMECVPEDKHKHVCYICSTKGKCSFPYRKHILSLGRFNQTPICHSR